MLQDFRYAARLLRRNPLFALTAALSLAIGIGANTAIFTIANALLFRPPAGVVAPGRLVDVGRSQDGEGFDNSSYPNYLDIRARNTVFDGIYAYRFERRADEPRGRDRKQCWRRTHLRRHGDAELLHRPGDTSASWPPVCVIGQRSSRAPHRSRFSATRSGSVASTAIPASSGRR